MSPLTRIGAPAALAVVLAACSGDASHGDPLAFCRRLQRLGELVAASGSGPENIDDVPAARALADDIATTAESLRETAPGVIADDVRVLAVVTADLARELRDFYEAVDDDPARANDPAFLSSFDPLSEERQEAIDQAGKAVRPWVEDHCDRGTPEPTSGDEPPGSGG